MNQPGPYTQRGTLLRGPDGELYCVPLEALAAFRVPEPEVARAEQAAQGTSIPGVTIEDASIQCIVDVMVNGPSVDFCVWFHLPPRME